MWYKLTLPVLAPLLAYQAITARRRVPRLPEPDGHRVFNAEADNSFRLLILGDSAAAGVGVGDQQQALSGQLVSRLSRVSPVSWRLIAQTGATTEDALCWLDRLPAEKFDGVVLSIGLNDLTKGQSNARWQHNYQQLRQLLRNKFDVAVQVVSDLPPIGRFPALPMPLRWVLGQRRDEFSAKLQQALLQEPDCTFLPLDFALPASAMASDGFHPGEPVYQVWAESIVKVLEQDLYRTG